MKALKKYTPLFSIILFAGLSSGALILTMHWSMELFMQLFMGIFLLQFSLLKVFDLKGFAKGFAKYDLAAKRSRIYGIAYPFLELSLALGYLSNGGTWGVQWVYLATIIIMGFGAIGVITALAKGLNTNCACLGTTLKVPLSTVAVAENVSMVAMATFLLTQ